MPSLRGFHMKVARLLAFLGMAVIALLLVFVTVTNQPNQDLVLAQNSLISSALSDNEANDANAENVNQQMVVNGWVAKDLLTINARQNVNLIELQSRTNALLQGIVPLLGLLVVAVASLGLAVNGGRRPKPEPRPIAATPISDPGTEAQASMPPTDHA